MSSKLFGQFGGTYVPETLMQPLEELNTVFQNKKNDTLFWKQINDDLLEFVGRPTPLYYARRWSRELKGAQIYLKREDLNHTGAHKINNCVGQAYLAKAMNKKRVIAETGAGQHGVATATVCARMGLEAVIFMGAKDIERQKQNVYRMQMLGAKVHSVASGTATLKDALNEAMRDWVTNIDDSYYMIGTAAGPEPYPEMVRDFQKIIGEETKQQALQKIGKLPDLLIACIGGGSNAIGLFYPFLGDAGVEMVGVEAGGMGSELGEHAASLTRGSVGILHGNKTYLTQDCFGQISNTHSISAGLDYPGVGPEHAFLKESSRVKYTSVYDKEAKNAFFDLCKTEGIIPALESSHALAYVKKIAPKMSCEQNIVVNLSGRGDKDLQTIINL